MRAASYQDWPRAGGSSPQLEDPKDAGPLVVTSGNDADDAIDHRHDDPGPDAISVEVRVRRGDVALRTREILDEFDNGLELLGSFVDGLMPRRWHPLPSAGQHEGVCPSDGPSDR
jgi:hypothetical protein